MSNFMQQLTTLSAAEEFFEFLDVPCERAVLNVNRLHILKRFHQYLRRETDLEQIGEQDQRAVCRALLTHAYEDFVRSTPAQEKVFKVFQDADGAQVSLANMRAALQEKTAGGSHG